MARKNRLRQMKWPKGTRHFFVYRNGFKEEYEAHDRTTLFTRTDTPPAPDDAMFIVHVRPH